MQAEKPKIYYSSEQIPEGVRVVEAYESALKELFAIEHPSMRKEDPARTQAIEEFVKNSTIRHRYLYYPWLNTAVHTVDEEELFKLRTARNKTIITEDEQVKYRSFKVGIAGLSVGSSAVEAMLYSGGPKFLKLADFDVLETTNLNRIKSNLLNLGRNKVDIVAEKVWELDPDAELELWYDGVSAENLEKFILDPKLDVFIDEMDNLLLKFKAREICRKNGIPVLMCTDNGDSVVADIERFDKEPERELFHGLVPEVSSEIVGSMPFMEWMRIATKIVGPNFLTDRMQQAVMEIGKTIPSVPQLGTTASIAGSTLAFLVRRLANNESLPSGRHLIGLDSEFIPGYNEQAEVDKRQQTAEMMSQMFSKPMK